MTLYNAIFKHGRTIHSRNARLNKQAVTVIH